jgi:hypothetical protein
MRTPANRSPLRSGVKFSIVHCRPLPQGEQRRSEMSVGTVLLVILVLALLGVIPTWPHSRSWGYGPSSALGVVVLIVLILFVLGKL